MSINNQSEYFRALVRLVQLKSSKTDLTVFNSERELEELELEVFEYEHN